MATLATEMMAWAHGRLDPEARAVADGIAAAGRLVLDREVAWGLDNVKTRAADLLAARTQGKLRLPLDPVWIEYCSIPPNPEPGRPVAQRIGYLLHTGDDGRWSVQTCAKVAEGLGVFPGVAFIQEDGIEVWADPGEDGDRCAKILEESAWIALRFLLMLTAKNAPFVTGKADDYVNLNKGRAKVGKPPVLGCRPVRWDLSRIERRAGPGGLTAEGRMRAIGHLVRGHPKVRKSGVFWWSPHYRNVAPGEPLPAGRDYRVAA